MSESGKPSLFSRLRKLIRNLLIFLLILFTIAPIILAAIPNTENNQTYSIFNESFDGYSFIRSDLEAFTFGNGPKYEAINIISNLNVLNRFNGSGALIIAGPAADFDLTETISAMLYMLRGGSLIIIDDFGSANDILDPIFSAFENIDKFSEQASNLGFEVPSVDCIFSGCDPSNETEAANVDPASLAGGTDATGADAATDLGGSFITNLIGKVILRFAFNGSVLMDVGEEGVTFNESPVRPIITDFDDTSIIDYENGIRYTFTEGIEKVQTEFSTIISVKVRDNQSLGINDHDNDPDTPQIETFLVKDAWQPLQKLSTALITGGDEGVEISLPFFPMYSSKLSWIETDMDSAADGTAVPDIDEWGNAKFAIALSIPLFPGMGKLIFLADPSIFINRWTQQVTENDNLDLFRNLIDMATFGQEPTLNVETGEVDPIPIIFDFGHVFQSFLSPALYSTALLKLIAEMSMFPLYAPFVPLAAYGYGKRLMPESRRLRPILLTKRRGEKGHSEFE
ncbi:MAG: hypothetical protein IH840_09570, partial [Candidatus Heimdallarchaeota archaeon]|nr:hypothetical protein [Candidatus Heimdallarchaeota archaeon]